MSSLPQPDTDDVHLLDVVQHVAESRRTPGLSLHMHLQVHRLRRVAHANGLSEHGPGRSGQLTTGDINSSSTATRKFVSELARAVIFY